MISLDGFDSVWGGYMEAAREIADSIEGRPLSQNLMDSTHERMTGLWNDWRAQEPLLPRIDAWIDPRRATFILIVRPQ